MAMLSDVSDNVLIFALHCNDHIQKIQSFYSPAQPKILNLQTSRISRL